MSQYYERCDDEFFDSDDAQDYQGLSLCQNCVEWFEENDGVKGKLLIEKCKTGSSLNINREVEKKAVRINLKNTTRWIDTAEIWMGLRG